MKFDCKEISITDEGFSCTVSLSENEDLVDPGRDLTIDEVIKATGQHIPLQKLNSVVAILLTSFRIIFKLI